MQKKREIKLKIDHTLIDLKLTYQKKKILDPCFFNPTSYPQVFFKPKEETFELYSIGACFIFDHIPKIQSPHYIPFLTLGEKNNTLCFIPKKWAIHKNGTFHVFTIENHKEQTLFVDDLTILTQEKKEGIAKIHAIIQAIKQGDLKKCVFSQIQKAPLSNYPTLLNFASLDKKGIFYYFRLKEDALFCGISPEWIYQRKIRNIQIDAIAGTVLKEHTSDLNAQKIIEEFNLVKEGIQTSMEQLCSTGFFFKKDQILIANHLAHRFNTYQGHLTPSVNDQTLLLSLHPTPAICGYPKEDSLKLLESIETSKRHFFGSPVGILNEKLAYIALGIRSSYIQKNTAFFFSGAGIVSDSDPEEEWNELMNKIKLMQSIIK